MNTGQTLTPWLLVLSLLLAFFILLLPAHPRDFEINAFIRLPLEVPLVVLLLVQLRGFASACLRFVLVVALGCLLILRLADIGSYLAFNRRFNPLVELHLIGDGWNLASQTVGLLEAGLVVCLAILLIAVLCYILYAGLGHLALLSASVKRYVRNTSILFIAVAICGIGFKAVTGSDVGMQASLIPDLRNRLHRMQRSIVDLTAFAEELANDPLPINADADFAALQGRDVIIIFIESYGRSFVEGERFTELAVKRLESVNQTVEIAGLSARSAWLNSPIRGGRSWLAHATFMSGLYINSQARFDRLISSDRQSLNRLFKQAGWQTAGIMPAIQLEWPEGNWYGFDNIFNNKAMEYQGQNFSWVSMPDQYTLSAFERLVREPADTPLMAEIALISSHAPWTPLPDILPWNSIGNGSVFDGSHRFGKTPKEVWSKREQVRDQYALSLDYSLQVVGEYMARYGDNALFIVLGDHQPASIINGWDATADVPIHIIANDATLLDRLPASHWTSGMHPNEKLPSLPMQSMRTSLARYYSDGTTAVGNEPVKEVTDEP